MSILSGKNVILYLQWNGDFKPIACFKNISLNTHSDDGETSSKNSGKWRTYRATKLSWSASASGLCSLDSNLTIPQLRQMQFNRNAVFLSWVATDTNGLVENYSGYCLIIDINETSDVSTTYDFDTSFKGVGELAITDEVVDPNECCDTLWIYYDGVGGEFNTGSIAELIGNKIDGRVYRDGIEYRPSGVDQDGLADPVGKQFKFDTVTGTIYFDTALPPLETDEQIDIPYLTCTDDNSGDCVPVAIESALLPNGVIDQPYSEMIGLTGTSPFTLQPGAIKPDWMSISISGTNVVLSGVPTEADTDLEITFTITNCSGSSDSFTDTIDVTDCVPVTIDDSPALPDVAEDTDYDYSFTISGSGPINLFVNDKPDWMTIELFANVVSFTGHAPTHHADNHVQIQLINCTDVSVTFEDTFDITF